FVMYGATHAAGLNALVLAACESAGFVPVVAQEATQIPTVLALVESGLGVALVPETMRGHRAPRVVYREVGDAGDLREASFAATTLSMAHVAGNESPAARRFIEMAGSSGASSPKF
ncbi:MAG: LysR family substrate-binding domain-containing protein, partial [Gammaproteobacteria bacterium]|nr:LysR family substrate-binding domain-containing protein [Gammaproteobacteria bacterium]